MTIERLKIFFGDDVDFEQNRVQVNNNGLCMEFYIYDKFKEIYLSSLSKCNMSGTENLQSLIVFASSNNYETITLEDQSYIKVTFNEFESHKEVSYNVDLAALNILTTSMSWYNRMGFKQREYKKDVARWKEIMEQTFSDIIPIILSLRNKDYNSKNWFDSPFYIMFDKISTEPEIDILKLLDVITDTDPSLYDITLKETCALIYMSLKDGSYKDDPFIKVYIALVNLLSYVLKYDRDELTLRI
jgi:hypothetical protein